MSPPASNPVRQASQHSKLFILRYAESSGAIRYASKRGHKETRRGNRALALRCRTILLQGSAQGHCRRLLDYQPLRDRHRHRTDKVPPCANRTEALFQHTHPFYRPVFPEFMELRTQRQGPLHLHLRPGPEGHDNSIEGLAKPAPLSPIHSQERPDRRQSRRRKGRGPTW